MSFPHTSRFFVLDNFKRWSLTASVIFLLMAAWAAWLVLGEVAVLEQSESGRLETYQRVHGIESPVAGKLLAVHAVLRQPVEAGDLLVTLDAEEQLEHIAEAEQKLESLRAREASVTEELRIEAELTKREATADVEAVREADLKFQQESINSKFTTLEYEKSAALRNAGLISEVEWLRLQGEAERHQAITESARQAIVKLEAEQRSAEAEGQKRLTQLEQERLKLREELLVLEFSLEHMGHEEADRQIRSPVTGIVGSITSLRSGALVDAGDRVAEIVPSGDVTVTAFFLPTALGRLRPGQSATLRLDAYPWPQYGTVPLTVDRLATEPDKGKIRVELTLAAGAPSAIPLEHGLTGTIEVEVERLSPLQLLLRSAGGKRARPIPEAKAAGDAMPEATS